MSGYQSNVDLSNLNFSGDIPAENIIGGFGLTTGVENNYVLTLDPPITEYRPGLALQVQFHSANTDRSGLSVNALPAIELKKVVNKQLMDVASGDLTENLIYDLTYDGTFFQITSGIPDLPIASLVQPGIAQFASSDEALVGTSTTRSISPRTLQFKQDAHYARKNWIKASSLFPRVLAQNESSVISTVILRREMGLNDEFRLDVLGRLNSQQDDGGIEIAKLLKFYLGNTLVASNIDFSTIVGLFEWRIAIHRPGSSRLALRSKFQFEEGTARISRIDLSGDEWRNESRSIDMRMTIQTPEEQSLEVLEIHDLKITKHLI